MRYPRQPHFTFFFPLPEHFYHLDRVAVVAVLPTTTLMEILRTRESVDPLSLIIPLNQVQSSLECIFPDAKKPPL